MTARKKILAGLVLLAIFGGVVWWTLASRIPKPIYQGEPLSSWLDDYELRPGMTVGAVHHAGTNAIPLLLRLMRAHDSPPHPAVERSRWCSWCGKV